jgi:hypothetical protein
MDFTVAGIFSSIATFVSDVFLATWWFWLFFILFSVARSTWLFWKNMIFEHDLMSNTVFMEMKIPRETLRSPRSMDQFFQAIAALRNSPGDLGEKYLDGEVTRWYTFEMCSFSGEIHFYMRVPKKQKMLVEAAMFSYYPEVELEEVEDYTRRLPHHIFDVEAQQLDMWGTEMILTKEGGYPLKTYVEFESPDEIHQVDPIAAFMENLGKARKGEFIGIQINAAPEAFDWGKQFEYIVEDLRTPKTLGGHGKSSDPAEIIKAVTLQKSPGQTQIMESIERNLTKPAFKCVIRFIYLSPKNIFYDSFARKAIKGSFNQYGAANLNSFAENRGTSTQVKAWNWPFVFTGLRNRGRKQRVLHSYLEREHETHEWMGKVLTSHFFNWNNNSKASTISTEGLASLFHPPMNLVTTAPHTQRVASKKQGAPAGLAIYADESVLDNYK